MTTAVAVDIETEKAVNTLREAGVPGDEIMVADDPDAADDVVKDGRRAVLADGRDLCRTDVDAAAEADHVPLELLDGAEVTGTVPKDEAVTYDHVDVEADSFTYHLRRLQEETL